MKILANCECGSKKLRLEYYIVNRNTHNVFWRLFCAECNEPSPLTDYLSNSERQHEYYNLYSQTHNIRDSYEQFIDKTNCYIKNKVIETVLKDEKGNPIKCWKNCACQEVQQYLGWQMR